MVLARLVVAAGLACVVVSSPADAAGTQSLFAPISQEVKAARADTGAPGAALLIGQKNAIFYVESTGKADLGTPIHIAAKSDLAQLTLMLRLADAGFLDLKDPADKYLSLRKSDPAAKKTIRGLMVERAAGGPDADRAATTLILIAQAASNRSWASLFTEWIAKPLAMTATSYPEAPALAKAIHAHAAGGVIATNTRDYARLLAMFANGGTDHDARLLSPGMYALALRPNMIGKASCESHHGFDACAAIEQDAVGFYAWVDPERDLYGVLAAPGAETSIAKSGRRIRAQAETIIDRENAGAGTTAAIKTKN